MKPEAILRRLAQSRARVIPLLVFVLGAGCQSTAPLRPTGEAPPSAEGEQSEAPDPDRPPPVLPEKAFFLSEYAALELTITAARDGSVQKVVVSKPSRAKLYDEYTRNWVEKNWKMPAAQPAEGDSRKFIAPIVYPKRAKPRGGSFPAPTYPAAYMRDRVEGLLIVEAMVAASGDVEATQIVLSSGHKGLDAYTADWVRRKWKFPPGAERSYNCPFVYLLK